MKYYRFDDPEQSNPIYSEESILDSYYLYWSEEMLIAGKSPLITEKNCIGDWIVVNWAWECDEFGAAKE